MARQTAPTPEQAALIIQRADLFSEHVLRRHLWSKQREVLQLLSQHNKVAVASCHSVGKSFIASQALLWFLYTRRPAVVVTTAPTWRQVEKVLWKYVNREFLRLPKDLQGLAVCLTTRLTLAPDHEAFGQSTDKPDQFQGIHSAHIMLIVDEAAGVSDEIYEAADTLGAGGEYRELLIGNPTSASGKFYRAFNNADLGYHTVKIDALETPNFTGEECPAAVAAELIQPSKVAEWKSDWGEDSPAYQSRVHANFPSGDEQAIICPLAWFDAARGREVEKTATPVACLGVDVARFGGDRSCLVERVGWDLQRVDSKQGLDTRELAFLVIERAKDLRARTGLPVQVNIDETGVGSGVVDQCKPHSGDGITYSGVNFGAAASDAGRFVNLRAEMYWRVRELLRQGNNEPNLSISAEGPETERLGAQLSATRYEYNGNEKIKIESKEKMRERGMPSPDEADAAVLAFLPGAPPVTIEVW